jgi:hypothetical protein
MPTTQQKKMDEAIENSLSMIRTNCRPDEALKFSQAALNLAHAKQLLHTIGKTKGPGS